MSSTVALETLTDSSAGAAVVGAVLVAATVLVVDGATGGDVLEGTAAVHAQGTTTSRTPARKLRTTANLHHDHRTAFAWCTWPADPRDRTCWLRHVWVYPDVRNGLDDTEGPGCVTLV